MISVYLCVLVLFPLIALIGTRKADAGTTDTLITKSDSAYLRGISALFVVFAHYFIFSEKEGVKFNSIIQFAVDQIGGIGVLLFFFVSGYGVYFSYKNRKPTLDFLLRRVKTVYIPYVIIKLVFLVVNLILNRVESIPKAIFYIITVEDWFIHVILILYILFFVFWKLDTRKFFIATLISNAALTVIYILLERPIGFFNALWLFTAGMFMAEAREAINKFFQTKLFVKIAICFVAFVGLGLIFALFKGAMWANIFKPAAGVAICLGIIGLLKVIKLNSFIINEVGKRSLYYYIVHIAVWNFMDSFSFVPRFWISLSLTVIVVELMYRCVNLVVNKNTSKG
ncbi:MAG: acyltransferase [Saccharofermentans sp.]|nr:acyltransferase [Saccharofermentans sp.]